MERNLVVCLGSREWVSAASYQRQRLGQEGGAPYSRLRVWDLSYDLGSQALFSNKSFI